MAKTTWTGADPVEFVEAVEHPVRRRDAVTLLAMIRRATGEEPRMFGAAIVGLGEYHYKYASGTEGDAPAAGFSPRSPHRSSTSTTGSLPTRISSNVSAHTPTASAASTSRTWQWSI